ncbi:unnamed protein product [Musa textilis]
MEDEGMMEDAPRKTQLWRVDHNSTFYFKRTPSPTSSSPTGSSVRRQRISLRFCTTSNREWWKPLTTRGRTASTSVWWQRRRRGARIWLMACKGLTMPPNTMRAQWEKTPRELSPEAEDGSSEIRQSTWPRRHSIRGTSAWRRRETILKTMSITESGSRPKWSVPSASSSSSFAASIRHSRDPKSGTAAGGRHRMGTLSIDTDRAIG